jgi:hypothetical protein
MEVEKIEKMQRKQTHCKQKPRQNRRLSHRLYKEHYANVQHNLMFVS